MKYIVGGRGCGKTHNIILESVKTGVHILCKDFRHRDMIVHQSKLMGVKIPTPLCIADVRNHHTVGIRCSSDHPLKVLIDDPMWMLRSLIGESISIECCSLDVESLQDVFILPDRPYTDICRRSLVDRGDVDET